MNGNALVIILVMLLINAGATLGLYISSTNIASSAETSARSALRVANQNERESVLRIDQSCLIAEKLKSAPAYCDKPGVGLKESGQE
jgi:hypothetical protein